MCAHGHESISVCKHVSSGGGVGIGLNNAERAYKQEQPTDLQQTPCHHGNNQIPHETTAWQALQTKQPPTGHTEVITATNISTGFHKWYCINDHSQMG